MMHQTPCECERADCPTDNGYFYASIRNDNGQHRLLLGPFPAHADALASVPIAQQMAERYDARACWYAYGTARTETAIRPLFTACSECGELGYLSRQACRCTVHVDAQTGKAVA